MQKPVPVLAGFVQLIDVMGCDKDIVDAARTSYGKDDPEHDEIMRYDDVNLLEYLMRHRHTSPFEMCEVKFLVEAPMDVWRQWIRHRTANVNEYSTRYRPAIDRMEKAEEWRAQSTNNKQGSRGIVTQFPEGFHSEGFISPVAPQEYLSNREQALQELARDVYEERIEFGVALEQARKDLPLSTYTRAMWKIDLHNLLHFLSLRCDSHAQHEIRAYADAMLGAIELLFPVTVAAFRCYRMESVTLSARDQLGLKRTLSALLDPTSVSVARLCDSVPEWKEALERTGKYPREAVESCDKIRKLFS